MSPFEFNPDDFRSSELLIFAVNKFSGTEVFDSERILLTSFSDEEVEILAPTVLGADGHLLSVFFVRKSDLPKKVTLRSLESLDSATGLEMKVTNVQGEPSGMATFVLGYFKTDPEVRATLISLMRENQRKVEDIFDQLRGKAS